MYKEIQLRAEKVATAATMDLDIICDSLVEYETQSLVLRLSRYVYTSEEQSIRVPLPDGVWQHFKQDYFPVRWLEKYPVRYKYIIVKAKEAFPHLSFLANNKARHLHLRVYEPSENVYRGTRSST